MLAEVVRVEVADERERVESERLRVREEVRRERERARAVAAAVGRGAAGRRVGALGGGVVAQYVAAEAEEPRLGEGLTDEGGRHGKQRGWKERQKGGSFFEGRGARAA